MTAAEMTDDTDDLAPGSKRRKDGPDVQCRWDAIGPLRWMGAVDEFVVVRRPASYPFIMGAADWASLPSKGDAPDRLDRIVQWGVVEENLLRRSTDRRPAGPPPPGPMSRVVPISQAR